MKKSIIKSATSLILCVGVLLSAMIFSANAESKSTVQKWDFTKFEDYSFTHTEKDVVDGGHDAILSSDGNISLGCSNKYWNQQHDLKIENGKITQTDLNKWGSGIEFIMNFKLSSNLTEGQTYTFATDLCKTGAWPRVCLYYTDKISNGYNDDSNDHVTVPSDAIQLYKAEGGEDVKNFTVTFKASANMNAGGYLNLRFKTGSRDIVSSISSVELYKTAKETPVANAWDFTKFGDYSYTRKTNTGLTDNGHAAIVSSDENISIGTNNVYWNQYHDLKIENGKLTQTEIKFDNSGVEFVINFKLTQDLLTGSEYTFKTDLATSNDYVKPALYYSEKISNSPNWDSNEDVTVPSNAMKLYQKTGDALPQKDFSVTFTATADMKAGGWLNLRYKTGGRDTVSTISKASLIESTDETLVSGGIKLLDGAQVRYDEPTGLRFITNVNTSVETELTSLGATDIKYGTLIVPKDYLEDTEFTKKAFAEKGTNILDIEYTGDKAQKGEGENTYFEMKAAIVNIKAGNYKREFVARAYVTYKIGETEYTTYSDYNLVDNSRSVNFVANKLINDKTEFDKLNETRQNNVKKFAN